MQKRYAILNLVITIAVIVWNYATNVIGINGNTVGSLSDDYANLFTPAGYAFAIWGLIFISLIAFCIFQVIRAYADNKDGTFIEQIGPWYTFANLGNAAWLWFWLNEVTWLTVLLMLFILFSLLKVVVRLNMNNWDAPRPIKTFVWFPIGLYSGWITVATIANVAAYLAKINFDAVFPATTWTIIMLVAAVLINILVVTKRNIVVFGMVGVWALTAIAVRHWGSIPAIQWTALSGALAIVVAILLSILAQKKIAI